MRAHAEPGPDSAQEAPAALALPAALPQLVAAPGRAATAVRAASAMRLQRACGNAAVRRMLAREAKKPPPAILLTHGLGSVFATEDSGDMELRDSPDPAAPVVGQLKVGQSASLIGTVGDFYAIELDGKRYYVNKGLLATAIDTPGAALHAGWDKRLKDMQDKLDQTGHPPPPPPKTKGGGIGATGTAGALSPEFMKLQERLSASTTWDADLEAAQLLLREYATWYWTSYHQTTMPANVADFLKYLGRGTKNYVAAEKGKFLSSGHLGGTAGPGTKAIDWCTGATSQAVLDAIGAPDKPGKIATIQSQLAKSKQVIIGKAAYTAVLEPGDMVMYLFDGCQFGGHAVTVVDDLGTSFTHVSGNSTNSAVMMGEAKRMTSEPANFELAKATPGPVYKTETGADGKEKKVVDKDATSAAHTAATNYIAKFSFGGAVLVYSIVRYGSFLEGLAAPKPKP